ncbi:MAG: hypothetical protein R2737_01010 [Candidatus Nanopelagicales bacterium]
MPHRTSTSPAPGFSPSGFPQAPAAATPLESEPVFDPAVHLAIGAVPATRTLSDLGYPADRVDAAVGPVAVSEPFPLLTPAGVAALRQVATALEGSAIGGHDDRAPRYVPGGGYRSGFLRDLCSDPTLLGHLSEIAQVPLRAHPLVDCQAYVNYAPRDLALAVDTWHADSVAVDIVVMLSDPQLLRGGRFEWFEGTDDEAAHLLGTTRELLHLGGPADLPADRVRWADFPAAGWAVLQQGTHVVHRAARVEEAAERTTLVLGFAPADPLVDDATRVEYVATWPHDGLAADLARRAADLAARRLDAVAAGLDPDASADACAQALEDAAAEVVRTAAALRAAAG